MFSKKRIAFAILFFALGQASAQDYDNFFFGKLIDATTGEPVVFATVRLKSKAMGVISNQDGSFRIPQRFLELGEYLVISCLGYETREIRFSDLNSDNDIRIKLDPQALELKETTVVGKRRRPPSPRKIVKRAIERIPDNYSFLPFNYVGYYRDYQERDGEYLNLNESILKVFDPGFGKNDYLATQSRIFDYKKNFDFKRDADIEIPYDYLTQNKVVENAELFSFGGNEFFILRIHDAIRNYDTKTFSYVDILEKDLIRNHSLSRRKDSVLGDEKMFVIGLESSNSNLVEEEYVANKDIADIRSEGRLYISQSSYAIHKLDYKMFDYTNIRKSGDKKKKVKPKLLYEVAIEYSQYDGKMYPNYLSVHNAFKVRKSYFRVEEIVFELDRNRFVIKTNNPPIFVVQRGLPNVVLKFKKRKVPIKDMRNSQDGILVYPDDKQINQILEELEFDQNVLEDAVTDIFQFEFSNIKDENGNTLNDFIYEEYHQYREFFTQQVITDSIPNPPNEWLMKKNRPIFKDQPISKPSDFGDFWMNTPLKSRP